MRRHRTGRQIYFAYLCSAWVAILMAAPLASALAPASAGAGRPADPFRAADLDGDGAVSPAESARLSGFSALFAEADADRDEKLDRAEFRRALQLRDGRR